MTWLLDNKPYGPSADDLESLIGFVYCILEKETGMKYIGKKLFWRSKILPVTKSRKRRKKTRVESDWISYYGSSILLKEQVEKNGAASYERTILKLCTTKGQCSYYEAKYQFENDVLLRDDYYNEFIGCKIHSKHLT
tara:strand:+ start:354 stop:764 length:411 start_codon:yes stop_codon:yes gene_type:complete